MINCSSRPLERYPVQTHHIHIHVWRFLLGQKFNWFLYNWTKWRATQTDLPPQYFRAGYCPSPSVRALENFKGIKEWESTDIRQSSKQSSPNLPSTDTFVILQAQLTMAPLLFISHHVHPWDLQDLRHSRQFSATALLDRAFLWSSLYLSPRMSPKGYNSTRFPIISKLSKYCTSFHSLLNFCNCLTTWFLVLSLHSDYRQQHS